MERKVTMIPPTINPQTHLPKTQKVKRKVAGYARVSTDFEEQLTSYAAQVDYYTKYIQKREDWEFVKVYTDEGISATSMAHRDGFNQMIADALDGKIDLIITKSVSRFARNTVDSLTTVRKLKEKNVEVYFEKENIYTLDSKGELLITIMSSLAQEESRSISENVTWGHRKRFADGKVSLPYKRFLGYRKGADGLPEIVPDEAEIVRQIYKQFLEGKSYYAIAKNLTDRGIPTPAGKEQWHIRTIGSILTNEKYKGSALLQKKFTVDFLTKKTKVNEGEVPQYYIEESHPAIISPEEFELVQAEMAKRKQLGRKFSGNDIFSAKIICGDCGGFFGAKVWHSNSKYRRVIWQCNQKFSQNCTTPHLYEDEIKMRFLTAFASFFQQRDLVLETCQMLIDDLSDTTLLDLRIEKTSREMNAVAAVTKKHIAQNAETEQDQEEYDQKYHALVQQYEKLQQQFTKLQQERAARINRMDTLHHFLETISAVPQVLDSFDVNMIKSAKYQAMLPLIKSIVPENSIVGMLLEHDEDYIIVKSSQSGLMQHDAMSWQVLGAFLVKAKKLSAQSRRLNKALSSWINSVDNERREEFVETLFGLLYASGAKNLSDVSADRLRSTREVIRQYAGLDKDSRTLIKNMLLSLTDKISKARFEK